MGLLEKALQFKNDLNSRGRETLIDRIAGPAQTVMIHEEGRVDTPKKEEEEIVFLSENELDEIEKDDHLPDENPAALDADSDLKMKAHEKKTQKDERAGVLSADDEYPPDNADDFDDAGAALVQGKKSDDTTESFFTGLFSDYMVLYETCKEIAKTGSVETLFESLSFLVMGQIGVSSSALLLQNDDNPAKWHIAESRGITIENRDLNISSFTGILAQLMQQKRIIDIEAYSDDERFTDEFYTFISIDARLLVPLRAGGEIIGIVTVGDKITAENYTEEEKDYLYAIAEFSALHLQFMLKQMHDSKENDSLEKNIRFRKHVDSIRDEMSGAPDVEQIREILQNEFRSLGIECFGVFIRAANNDKYVPLIYEREDLLLYGELDFGIKAKSHFISFLREGELPLVIDDIAHSRIISEVFNENQVVHFSQFRVYPARLGSEIPGFILLNRIADRDRLEEIDIKVGSIASFIFSMLISIEAMNIKRKKYVDNIEVVYKKIEDEIANARNLNIPVTLILFSIKNYKRYYNLYGIDEARQLLGLFEKIIKNRLSDGDFAVRYDRHKILVALPGKDKKFAVPLANTIRNEIVHSFRKKDIQLLLSFLTAEFPEDGNNVHSLIDAID